MDRCQAEIAAVEAQIRAGHPDLQGLCLALADWSAELRLLRGLATVAPRLAHVRSCSDGLACGPRMELGRDQAGILARSRNARQAEAWRAEGGD